MADRRKLQNNQVSDGTWERKRNMVITVFFGCSRLGIIRIINYVLTNSTHCKLVRKNPALFEQLDQAENGFKP